MSSVSPFDYLAALSHRVLQLNPQLPSEGEVQNTWTGIGFSVLGQHLIAPLGEIIEIIPVPNITRLPNVQSWVIGLANVRGRLLPLFDLEAFMGGKLSNSKARHRVLILEMGELYSGLVVSDAYGMQYFPEDLTLHKVPEDVEVLAPYSKGAYEFNGSLWTYFSPYQLISDPRFFNAAKVAV